MAAAVLETRSSCSSRLGKRHLERGQKDGASRGQRRKQRTTGSAAVLGKEWFPHGVCFVLPHLNVVLW